MCIPYSRRKGWLTPGGPFCSPSAPPVTDALSDTPAVHGLHGLIELGSPSYLRIIPLDSSPEHRVACCLDLIHGGRHESHDESCQENKQAKDPNSEVIS